MMKKGVSYFWVVMVLAFMGLSLALGTQANPVQAQGMSAGSSQASCVSCHEDLYYLHDTGKWYCLEEHTERCTNCHGGNSEATRAQDAHENLIADPLSDGGSRCQTCHVNDAQTRIDFLVKKTGYTPAIHTAAYVPNASLDYSAPISSNFSERKAPNWFMLTAISAFSVWLWIVLRFGE